MFPIQKIFCSVISINCWVLIRLFSFYYIHSVIRCFVCVYIFFIQNDVSPSSYFGLTLRFTLVFIVNKNHQFVKLS